MDFRTIVPLPEKRLDLTPRSSVLLLGSCFADEIGTRMRDALPERAVCANPFGALYNPESLRQALGILLYGSLFFPDDYLFQGADGLWHCWLNSGSFSAPTREECGRQVTEACDTAAALLRRADMVCVTFGTNRLYELRERGIVVANCHREAATRFTERAQGIDEIVDSWGRMLADLYQELPSLRVVFTVSPYRYAKYGLHGSQLAKAALLLAVERLCEAHPNALYFPAYEMVLDELRDYRFFNADMLHPSPQAADYVWQRFSEWVCSDELRQYTAERASLLAAEAHRPLHPDSEGHRKFQIALEKRRAAFERKWGVSVP